MNLANVHLSDAQKKKLVKAMKEGTDFSVKLANQHLSGTDPMVLGKVAINKLAKNQISGKGMVVKMTSNQVKQLAKQLGKQGGVLPAVVAGAMTVDNALKLIGWAGDFAKATGIDKQLKVVLNGVVDDFAYLIANPANERYRRIYVERIPNLGMRYDKLGNKIVFIQNKVGVGKNARANRINRLELRRANIVALVKKLLMQLPRIAEYIKKKDNVLLKREYDQAQKEINEAEKAADIEGSGMDEVEGGLLMAGLTGLATVDALARPIGKFAASKQKDPKKKARSEKVGEMGLLGLIPDKKKKSTASAKKVQKQALAMSKGTGFGSDIGAYALGGVPGLVLNKKKNKGKGLQIDGGVIPIGNIGYGLQVDAYSGAGKKKM